MFKVFLDQVPKFRFSHHILPPSLTKAAVSLNLLSRCSFSQPMETFSASEVPSFPWSLPQPHRKNSLRPALSELVHPICRSWGLRWAVSSLRAGCYSIPCLSTWKALSRLVSVRWIKLMSALGETFCIWGLGRLASITWGSHITPKAGRGICYVPESEVPLPPCPPLPGTAIIVVWTQSPGV